MQLELDKLPDLVINTEDELNTVTLDNTSTNPPTDHNKKPAVVPLSTDAVHITETMVMPENVIDDTEMPEFEDTVTQVPVGHDSATTTDDEEAVEALLALGNPPDYDDNDNEPVDDNAMLMPIG